MAVKATGQRGYFWSVAQLFQQSLRLLGRNGVFGFALHGFALFVTAAPAPIIT
jgi:hypothetical protein